MSFFERSRSTTPSSSSSALTCMLKEGCVTKQCSAASEKLPQLATASRYSSWIIVITGVYLRKRRYKKNLYRTTFSHCRIVFRIFACKMYFL